MHHPGDREGVETGRLLNVKIAVPGFERVGTTHAGSHRYSKTRPLLFHYLEAAGSHGFTGGDQAELAETVHEIQLLLGKVVGGAIVRDLTGDLHAEVRRIELGDARNTGTSMDKTVEKASNVLARGGNNTQAGDGYSSYSHSDPLCGRPVAVPLT